jgi:hypothetical protein
MQVWFSIASVRIITLFIYYPISSVSVKHRVCNPSSHCKSRMISTFSTLLFFLLASTGRFFASASPTSSSDLNSRDQVNSEYDYVIIGGGTAGLTVADRLTESGKCMSSISFLHTTSRYTDQAFQDTVLVIEYGEFGNYHHVLLSCRY